MQDPTRGELILLLLRRIVLATAIVGGVGLVIFTIVAAILAILGPTIVDNHGF